MLGLGQIASAPVIAKTEDERSAYQMAGGFMEELPDATPPYLPSGLDDPRLAKNSVHIPGSASRTREIKDNFDWQLYRYAKQLYKDEKYKEALSVIDGPVANNQVNVICDPTNLYIDICLALANKGDRTESEPYYNKVIAACDKKLNGSHSKNYFLPKALALARLGKKEEAITSCQTAYNYAFARGTKTDECSTLLKELTGKDEPSPEFNNRNLAKIQSQISALINRGTCPRRAEIEQIFGEKFDNNPALSDASKVIESRCGIYSTVIHRLPHTSEESTILTLDFQKEAAAITVAMIQAWIGNTPNRKVSKGSGDTIYEFPWGEISANFFPRKPNHTYRLNFIWNKSSETDGLEELPRREMFTLQDGFQAIDLSLSQGNFGKALDQISSLQMLKTISGSPPNLAFKSGVRERLIRLKQLENKPEVVAYIQTASFEELVKMLEFIKEERRSDFFTSKERDEQIYNLGGKLDKNFKGHLLICGYQDERIALIEKKTPAAEKLLKDLKISLPVEEFKLYKVKGSSLPGPLLDKIDKEQRALEVKSDDGSASRDALNEPVQQRFTKNLGSHK
ncbi:hypothetical protein BH11CYA1_BH11CYA1_26660 [soil metagenome]